MTAVERRFTTSHRQVDSTEPGLVLEDDGTIWRVKPDGTREELTAGGGSQPGGMRVIDGGTHTAVALLNGPVTIYTPAVEEEVWAALISSYETVTGPGNHGAILVTTEALKLSVGGDVGIAKVTATAASAMDSFGRLYNGDTPDGSNRLYPLTDPILVAGLQNSFLVAPGGPWQSATTYQGGDGGHLPSIIVMAGRCWQSAGIGAIVSGNVQPDFAGNIGGSVADGPDIVWQDQDGVPTTGSVTVRLLVATPALP